MSGASDPCARAKADALGLLDKRAFSRAKLMERLLRKGHSAVAAEHAADEMVRLRLIDDRAMAQDLIERELAYTPAARAHLERRAAARGIDPAAASQAIDEALAVRDSTSDVFEAARALAARMPRNLDSQTLLRRLAGRLVRRGFDEEESLEAARRVIGADHDAP